MYCIVIVLSTQVVRPLLAKQPLRPSWPALTLLDGPIYFIGAAIAVAVVELIARRNWELLPVAAVPLFFALRTYGDYMRRVEDAHRRSEVIDSLEQGMCVVDGSGRVTLWNDTLERIAGVSRELALGAPLVSAMPALANTELPRAIGEALKDRTPRDIAKCSAGARRRSADAAGQVTPGVGWPDAALARHHGPNERGPFSEAQRRAARAGRRGRQRRMVGMGPSHERVLLLGAGGVKSSAFPVKRASAVRRSGSTACIQRMRFR